MLWQILIAMESFDVAVLGAGAAGLMTAIEAGRRGRKVVVLEKNERVGLKIAISGGGRCNFTNLGAGPENYLSQQPDFCKSALSRYSPWDFVALVEKHRIAYHEKKLGQQFCSTSSRAIIEMLLSECREAGVEVRTEMEVLGVERDGRFRMETKRGVLTSETVVVASGGLSFPKLGANDFGYRLARQFGLRMTELRPGLVPLTLSGDEMRDWLPLSGVSLPVSIRSGGAEFAENLLFTHRGLSGPAVLQISSYWRSGEPISIDLLEGASASDWLAHGRRETGDLTALLAQRFSRRFAEAWAGRFGPSVSLYHTRGEELARIAATLNSWTMHPTGTEGYAKAEVTLGGVSTSDLSSKTMEARKVPGLFFVGEVVDVTGWLGGYNFQWAWASGWAAGQCC